MYDFFSQLAAFRKSFEGLQLKVVDLSHLPHQEAGGSGFHGTLIAVRGVCLSRLVAVCLTGPTITGAAGGGMTRGTWAPLKAAAAPRS